MILIMPIMQLIVIPLAADYEIKHISISVVDQDHSSYSSKLVNKMTASGYFQLVEYTQSYAQATKTVGDGKTDLILTIPAHFERDLIKFNKAQLHLAADAVNGVRAGLGTAYAAQMIGCCCLSLMKCRKLKLRRPTGIIPILITICLWCQAFWPF
jgi:ABC-2 type transport system permease protein